MVELHTQRETRLKQSVFVATAMLFGALVYVAGASVVLKVLGLYAIAMTTWSLLDWLSGWVSLADRNDTKA